MIAQTLENDLLLSIQKQRPKDAYPLPGYEDSGYQINLATRTIESPEFLSVEKDHDSEIKYFVIDRYLDHKDLSTVPCVVQYENALGEHFIYPVPFVDTYTLRDSLKMIIPWNISGSASKAPGEITYSFRFFEFEAVEDDDGKIIDYNDKLIYNLSTLPATSKILYGLNISLDQPNDQSITYKSDAYNILFNAIYNQDRTIYWRTVQ